MLQCLVSSFYKTIDAIWYLAYLSTCCFCICFNKNEKEEEEKELKKI